MAVSPSNISDDSGSSFSLRFLVGHYDGGGEGGGGAAG